MNAHEISLQILVGQTLKSVVVSDNKESITFTTLSGEQFRLEHHQYCCENVQIESIVGDLEDLIGAPILKAEQSSGETPADYKFDYEPESYTWTFYKFATLAGYVDIRWLGESNGYYSEEVSFFKLTD